MVCIKDSFVDVITIINVFKVNCNIFEQNFAIGVELDLYWVLHFAKIIKGT